MVSPGTPFKGFADDIANAHADFVSEAQRRLAKKERYRARCGAVYDLQPINGHPLINGYCRQRIAE
jgi:hypothetical protein